VPRGASVRVLIRRRRQPLSHKWAIYTVKKEGYSCWPRRDAECGEEERAAWGGGRRKAILRSRIYSNGNSLSF
jgi:hypothetical protein